VPENTAVRGVFGTERGECQEREGNCTLSSFMICALQTAETVSGQLSWAEHAEASENCTQNFGRKITVYTETQYLNWQLCVSRPRDLVGRFCD
jgi:hypothetical protein